jgi:hypothetical protein
VTGDTNNRPDVFVHDRDPGDITPPTTTHSTDPAPNAAGWNNTPVMVTLTAEDEPSGSGVAYTFYFLSLNGVLKGYMGSFPVFAEGEHSIQYWSEDASGNVEPYRYATVRIDTTVPMSSSNAAGSYTGSATITLSATDTGGSGVKRTEWSLNGGAWQTGTVIQVNASGSYTLKFRSTDNVGNVEDEKTATFTVTAPPVTPTDPVSQPTTIALTSKSNSTLGYGKAFRVAGTLKDGAAPLRGRQVTLLAAAPGKGFAATPLKATTNASGSFSFDVKPASKTSYKVSFAGDSAYTGTTCAAYVTATPKVSLAKPSAKRTKARTYTVSGSLKPAHSKGSTKVVRIYKEIKVGKKWVKKGYVKAKLTTTTKYSAKVKFPKKGTWRLKAVAPADSLHAKTETKYKTVKVK